MTFDEYQDLSAKTERPLPWVDERLQHGMLGIITEAGELGDVVKKHVIYDKPLDRDNIEEEIGDLLWYVACLARAAGASLDKAAVRNLEKLRRRYPNGVFSSVAALTRADKLGAEGG